MFSKKFLNLSCPYRAGDYFLQFLTGSAVREGSDRVLTSSHWPPRRREEREKQRGRNPYESLPALRDVVYHPDRQRYWETDSKGEREWGKSCRRQIPVRLYNPPWSSYNKQKEGETERLLERVRNSEPHRQRMSQMNASLVRWESRSRVRETDREEMEPVIKTRMRQTDRWWQH